jgi:hypothetical protein
VASADTACDPVTYTQSVAIDSVLGLGNSSVSVTVYDTNSNPTVCSTTISVVDIIKPTIICPAPVTQYVNSTCVALTPSVTGGITVSDNCGILGSPVQTPAAGTPLSFGEYGVVVSVSDTSLNSAECGATVIAVDNSLPSISCTTTLTLDAGAQCVMPSLSSTTTSSDNCGVTSFQQIPAVSSSISAGDYQVNITALDDSGNRATCTSQVTFVDSTPPSITTCAPSKNLDVNAVCKAAIPDMVATTVATDNCRQITVTQSVDASTLVGPGTYPVTITVTDAVGMNYRQVLCSGLII